MKKIRMSELSKRYWKSAVIFLIIMLASCIVISGCGGSGGDGGENSPPAKEAVTISGKVEIRDQSAPLSGAECRFVDGQGGEQASATSDEAGQYTLEVPVDMDGDIRCTPSGFSNLALSTYCSTKGLSAGDVLEAEDVTIVSTVTAQVLTSEAPSDPVARKTELMEMIASGQDPDYDLVTQLSADLYTAMLQNHLDIGFSGGISGPADSDGGGISGQVGTGVGQTPIAGAQCRFMVDDDLGQGRKVLRNAVLADFFDDGRLSRPDLQAVQEQVNDDAQGREQAIIDAFARVFPNGIGQAYAATSDENGNYALAVPPDTPGYVCCTPPDQDQLVLEAYVPGRSQGETMTAQDVNPATTVHSVQIASRLGRTATDIQATKDNYLAGIAGMEVQMLQEGGPVTGFELTAGTTPADKEAGLAAFCATALFNSLYHNQLNADFSAMLVDFFQQQGVDPAFLADQGIGADDAQTISEVVGAAVTQAETGLGTQVSYALSTARINVTVLETPDGSPLPDFNVSISAEDLLCRGCDTLTDDQGQVTLSLLGLSNEARTIAVTVFSSDADYTQTIEVLPMADQDVVITLNNSSLSYQLNIQGDPFILTSYDGSGIVTSSDGQIDCPMTKGSENSITACEASLESGSSVTLTAVPSDFSTFTGWGAEGSACSGTEPTCTLSMDRDHTVVALFSPRCEEEHLFDISQVYFSFTSIGDDDSRIFGGGSILTNVPPSCGRVLTPSTDSEWISFNTDYSGYLAYLNIDVPENPDTGPRSGTLLYGGHPVAVAQDGQQCAIADYGVDPISTRFDAAGGTGTIEMRAPAHCPWNAVTDSDWITITSDATGSGGGTMTYLVAENTGAARAGYITIAGTQHMVVQSDAVANPPLALTIQGEGEGSGYIHTEVPFYLGGEMDMYSYTCNISGSHPSGKCNMIYKPDAKVVLVAWTDLHATPHHSLFSNWTGSCSGAFPECQVTMDQLHMVGANFILSNRADLAVTELGIDTSRDSGNYIPVGTPIGVDNFISATSGYNIEFDFANFGIEDARNFSIVFYISSDATITTDDILLAEGRWDFSVANAQSTNTYTYADGFNPDKEMWIPTDLSPGPAYLGVILDVDNSVSEDVEANNTYSIPVYLVPAESRTVHPIEKNNKKNHSTEKINSN